MQGFTQKEAVTTWTQVLWPALKLVAHVHRSVEQTPSQSFYGLAGTATESSLAPIPLIVD